MAEEFDPETRKKLINKYQLDKYYIPLLLIGMEYGLSEDELSEYLVFKDQGLTAMHRKMMEVVFSAYKYEDYSAFKENRMEFIRHFRKILQRHIDVEAMEAQKNQNSENNVELNGGEKEDEYRALRERLAALPSNRNSGTITEGDIRKRLADLRIDGGAGETETAAFRERLDHIRADQREWENSIQQIANAAKDAENSVRLAANTAKRCADQRAFGKFGSRPGSGIRDRSGTDSGEPGSEFRDREGHREPESEIRDRPGAGYGEPEQESNTRQYSNVESVSGSADLHPDSASPADGDAAEPVERGRAAAQVDQQIDYQETDGELNNVDRTAEKEPWEEKRPGGSFFGRLTKKGRKSLEREKIQEEKKRYSRLTGYILEHTDLEPQRISAVTYARDVGLPENVIIRMLDEKADSQSIRNAATFYTFNHGK